MALGSAQSSTSSSASASATQTPTGTQPHARATTSGPFSPNASPVNSNPLILAFLAIGLFAIGSLMLFGLRRMRADALVRRRIVNTTGLDAFFAAGVGAPEPPVPTLHDRWAEPGKVQDWKELNPLSATVVSTSISSPPPPPAPAPVLPALPLRVILARNARDTFRLHFPRLHAPARDAPLPLPHLPADSLAPGTNMNILRSGSRSDGVGRESEETGKGKEIEDVEGTDARLKVAFAIAMPRPLTEMRVGEDEDVLVYEIGVMERPWRTGVGEDGPT